MPKFQIPPELLAKNKKLQLDEFKKKNKICTFEQFLETVQTGNVNAIQKLNYLDNYVKDKTEAYNELDSLFNFLQLDKTKMKDMTPEQRLEHLTKGYSDSTPYNDTAALPIAVEKGHIKMVEFLLAEGADPNVQTYSGLTSLHLASRDAKMEIINLLLSKGAKVEAQSNRGWTALHIAVSNGKDRIKVAELLLNKGANLHAKTKEETLLGYDGCTPLHVAVQQDAIKDDQVPMIKFLLNRGAALEAENDVGCNPLHWAAAYGSTKAAEVLLDFGANLEAKVKKGATPLYIAAQNNRLEIVKLLLDRGANINVRAENGLTLIDAVLKEGHHQVVSILKERAKLEKNVNSNSFKNKPTTFPQGFEFMKGVMAQSSTQSKNNKSRTQSTVSADTRLKVMPDSPVGSVEELREAVNKIIPNKNWKVPSSTKIWLQVSNEEEANEIVSHFQENGYQAIKIFHRKDAPKIPIILLENPDYDKLKSVPSLEVSEYKHIEFGLQ